MNNHTKTWTESGKARKKCDCGLYVHVRVKNCVCPHGFVKTELKKEIKQDNVIKIDLNKSKTVNKPKIVIDLKTILKKEEPKKNENLILEEEIETLEEKIKIQKIINEDLRKDVFSILKNNNSTKNISFSSLNKKECSLLYYLIKDYLTHNRNNIPCLLYIARQKYLEDNGKKPAIKIKI